MGKIKGTILTLFLLFFIMKVSHYIYVLWKSLSIIKVRLYGKLIEHLDRILFHYSNEARFLK